MDRRELTWTSEKPSAPGWYWWKRMMFEEYMRHLQFNPVGRLVDQFGNTIDALCDNGGEWAGPLMPPEEDGK